MSKDFPMQPIEVADDGVVRFRPNRIVRYLLDAGQFDMNHLAKIGHLFTREEHEHFAQLIGYSVSGFGELSYVSDEKFAEADEIAKGLL